MREQRSPHYLTGQIFQCRSFGGRQASGLDRHPRDLRATDRVEAFFERTRHWAHDGAVSQRGCHAFRSYPFVSERDRRIAGTFPGIRLPDSEERAL